MDRWRKTYQGLGFEKLDRSPIGLLIYGVAIVFWIHVAARLVFRTDLIPIFNGIEGLLFFALLAAPGNIRAALFITLGPNRKAYPNTDVDDLAPVRDPALHQKCTLFQKPLFCLKSSKRAQCKFPFVPARC